MNYQIVWSPGKIYDLVDGGGRSLATLIMEGGPWTPAREGSFTVGTRRWHVKAEGWFRHSYALSGEKTQVTAQNQAFYYCDLIVPIDGRQYRFEHRTWMIHWLTVSDDNNTDLIEVHNKWLRFGKEAGDVTFKTGTPDETQLFLAMFGFYQLRVWEYNKSD